MLKNLKKILILLLILSAYQIEGADVPIQSQERYFGEIDVTEIQFQNGMKVLIKPMKYEPGEVFVQMIAPGGYSFLEKEQRPSGILAAKIALESGLGTYSATELAYILYRDTIDLNIAIEKTHRLIDVNCRPESLESVFRIFHLIFKENKLDQKALETVIAREKKAIKNRQSDHDQNFECTYFSLNTENSKSLKSLSLKAIERVNLEKARDFYKQSFTNPSEFILSIVGDVEPLNIKPLLEKYLAVLENNPFIKGPTYPEAPDFPLGVNRRLIQTKKQNDAYARITIPIKASLTPQIVEVFDIANLILEKRLRNVIRHETGKTFGVDVGYELPMYPHPNYVWLTIHYHSPKEKVHIIEKLIIDEVKKMQKEEILLEELTYIIKCQKQNEEFWHKDDSFWLAKLMNYSLWNWDLSNISSNTSTLYNNIKPEDIRSFLYEAISCNNYTFIASTP